MRVNLKCVKSTDGLFTPGRVYPAITVKDTPDFNAVSDCGVSVYVTLNGPFGTFEIVEAETDNTNAQYEALSK